MLGKLIKHEWKGTYKMGCLMLGSMALITFLGWLAFQAPVWRALSGSVSYGGWLDVFSIITLMIYAMLLVCVNFGTKIYLGVRFYRTMYTDEGYLTHTLPVTKNQILISKILVSGIWTMIILLSIYLSLFLLGMSSMLAIIPDFTLADFFGGLGELFRDMELWFDFDTVRLLVMGIIMSLIGPFLTVTILFGGVSLGQLVSKGRLLMGILFYILILVADQLFVGLFRSFASSVGVYVNINLDASFIVNLLTAVILYVAAHFVISRKLNLV